MDGGDKTDAIVSIIAINGKFEPFVGDRRRVVDVARVKLAAVRLAAPGAAAKRSATA